MCGHSVQDDDFLGGFHAGANSLHSFLRGEAFGDSTTDASNTFKILGIQVPDGVTWQYGSDVTGNPLNFHYAEVGPGPSEVPEPSSLFIAHSGWRWLHSMCASAW